MPRSTRSFLFPDINVWIALTYRGHIHHSAATTWLDSVSDSAELCFCRFTQVSFLRLLTTAMVMGSQLCSQMEAWETYDRWLSSGYAIYVEEPPSLEQVFRSHSRSKQASPKDWADSYVLAFAQTSGLRLVTFDRALARKAQNPLLLMG